MSSKVTQRRVEYLRSLRRGASERVRDIVQDIVDLYQDRKISNYSTAEKLIKPLKSDNKRTVTFAIKRFEKNIDKWRGNEELRERMKANVKKRKQRPQRLSQCLPNPQPIRRLHQSLKIQA